MFDLISRVFGASRPRRRTYGRGSRPWRIETVEERVLLSAATISTEPALSDPTKLDIVIHGAGTPDSGDFWNDVVVSYDYNNAGIADDQVVVTVNVSTVAFGQTFTSTMEQRFPLYKTVADKFVDYRIERVEFYGRGGDDSFTNNTAIDSLAYGNWGSGWHRADIDVFSGGSGRDVFFGDRGDDVLYGYGGNDYLAGGDGADLIDGGDGNDSIYGGSNYGRAFDPDGYPDGDDTLFGGAGSDQIWGQRGNDVIYGGDGVDTIDGNAGDDWIYGGADQDFISGGDDNDTIFGGTGPDFIVGDDGDDTIEGGPGDDHIQGGNGTDKLLGNEGDDHIEGGNGGDYINGGDGNDHLHGWYFHRLDADDATVDVIFGGSGNDWLWGGAGNDALLGEDGNDFLFGELGSDVLSGGDGDDVLFGGCVPSYFKLNDILYINESETLSTIYQLTDDDIDKDGNDSLYGGDGYDRLFGMKGNDYLDGGHDGIADLMVGGYGDDRFKLHYTLVEIRGRLVRQYETETIVDFNLFYPDADSYV